MHYNSSDVVRVCLVPERVRSLSCNGSVTYCLLAHIPMHRSPASHLIDRLCLKFSGFLPHTHACGARSRAKETSPLQVTWSYPPPFAMLVMDIGTSRRQVSRCEINTHFRCRQPMCGQPTLHGGCWLGCTSAHSSPTEVTFFRMGWEDISPWDG